MIEQDTIKLLRECDAGVKMGVSSIDEVLPFVRSEKLEKLLTACKKEHEKLDREIQSLLDKYKDDGKNPNPMAKSMSWMKTNMKLMMEESDATIVVHPGSEYLAVYLSIITLTPNKNAKIERITPVKATNLKGTIVYEVIPCIASEKSFHSVNFECPNFLGLTSK